MTRGGYGNSLEWATSCPPPRHNFTRIPRIRSERPAFDLHYPQIQSGRTHEQRALEVGGQEMSRRDMARGTSTGRCGMKFEGGLFIGCAIFFGVV